MNKIMLEICAGTSCHLMGASDLRQVVEKLKIQYKEYLEIRVVPCLKQCAKGPNIRINGEIYMQITPEQLKKIVKRKIEQKGDANG